MSTMSPFLSWVEYFVTVVLKLTEYCETVVLNSSNQVLIVIRWGPGNQHVGQFHVPTSSRGGPRVTTHWPQSGDHPVYLFTSPHFDSSFSPSNLFNKKK